VPEKLKRDAQKKAGILSLSAVGRRLFEMWLNGEVELRIYDLPENEANE